MRETEPDPRQHGTLLPSRGTRGNALAGAVLGGTAVALGAFGTHGLSGMLTAARLATFETAVRYQMFHALALLAMAALPVRTLLAGRLVLAGTILFCGSLYLIVATNLGAFGAVAPIGGLLLIAGWVALAWTVARR